MESAEAILARTEKRWNLLTGDFGPIPRYDWLRCGFCGAYNAFIMIQHWRFHEKGGDSRVKYRCDVGMKCTDCAACWIHGVAIPEWYWKEKATRIGRRVYWREAAQL